jgi:CHAD domain-containing protein
MIALSETMQTIHRNPADLQRGIEKYLMTQSSQVFAPAVDVAAKADADALHQMRVHSRRLRIGLQFFSALFDPGELRQMQRQLRRLTRTLGEMRTLDVNVQLLRRAATHLPAATRPARTTLEHALLAERIVRLAEVRDLLEALRVGKFELRIRALVSREDRQFDPKRLVKDATAQLDELRRMLRRRLRRYDRKQSGSAFHKLRIAVKKYRYGLEAAQAVFAVKVSARIRAVETLQDLMGAAHDVEVLEDYLGHAQARHEEKDKTLASDTGRMLKVFRIERRRRMAAVADFLNEQRTWLRKIKLKIPA